MRNLRTDPAVLVRVDGDERRATAHVVEEREEDERARRLLLEKYGPRSSGSLERWGTTALPVALDLEP